MNKKQKIVLLMCVIIVLLMIIYPPKIFYVRKPTFEEIVKDTLPPTYIKYCYIFSNTTNEIAYIKLSVYLIFVLLTSAGLIAIFEDKTNKKIALLKYKCPKCEDIIEIPKTSLGNNIKCEKCEAEFVPKPVRTKPSKSEPEKIFVRIMLFISIITGLIVAFVAIISEDVIGAEAENWEYIICFCFFFGIGFAAVWLVYAMILLTQATIRYIFTGVYTKKLSLNQKRKLCLWIGTSIIVLMGLFPPVELGSRGYIEHSFILNARGPILLSNLIVQWAVVAIITGILIYTFRDKKPKDEKPKVNRYALAKQGDFDMGRTIVNKNKNKIVVTEIGPSGGGVKSENGPYTKPTISRLMFTFEDGKQVDRMAKAGDMHNMTDDELLALLENDIEGND